MELMYKCKCCDKKQYKFKPFLIGVAWKEGMYKCLETFIDKIQIDIKDFGRGEKLEMRLDVFEGEKEKFAISIQNKYVAEKERGKDYKDGKPKGDIVDGVLDNVRWGEWKDKIHTDFTKEIVKEWISEKIFFNEARDWLNTIAPSEQNYYMNEPKFFAWLKKDKGFTPESFLNKGNLKDLELEFDKLFVDKDMDAME